MLTQSTRYGSGGERVKRRHVRAASPLDRQVLERQGWRTTIEYRENAVRAGDGRLVEAVPCWSVEAERPRSSPAVGEGSPDVDVIAASGPTASGAWAALRDVARARRPHGR